MLACFGIVNFVALFARGDNFPPSIYVMKHIRLRALRGYYALNGAFRVGAFDRASSSVAVVVATMLTQRWRLRPAHGACRLAQPVAEALAPTSCGRARRLRPLWPPSCRTWRDRRAADHGVQVCANPPGLAGKALPPHFRVILLIYISRAAHGSHDQL